MTNAHVERPVGSVPAIITDAGERAVEQYQEFFAAFDNAASRRQYEMQAERFFHWAEERELSLASIQAFDIVFYVEELGQTLLPLTVSVYCSPVRRMFGHLRSAGVIGENPFDPDGGLPADSTAAVEWQAVVDAAELALIINDLNQAGFIQNETPVNKQLCERVIALGEARGITPDYDSVGDFLAALFGIEVATEPPPETKDASLAVGHETTNEP